MTVKSSKKLDAFGQGLSFFGQISDNTSMWNQVIFAVIDTDNYILL